MRRLMKPETQRVTQLLLAWTDGDPVALEELMPLVYRELRRIASYRLRRERPNHTLDSAALVNEAYLRLIDQKKVRWQNRSHFFAIAAQMMRRILVDHARAKTVGKRGGDAMLVSFDESSAPVQRASELVEIDEALDRLAAIDPRKSQVVELRFFAGLDVEETAAVLKVSPNTVMRDWRTAKAWLHRELSGENPTQDS
jgi:RNA polymerase sigma factor (TIGR02999 family)